MNKSLFDQHRSRVLAEKEYKDLEATLENMNKVGHIEVLEQVVTDPDYVARQ